MTQTLNEFPSLNNAKEIFKLMDSIQSFYLEAKLHCPKCNRLSKFQIGPKSVTTNTQFTVPRQKSISTMTSFDASWVSLEKQSVKAVGSLFIITCTTCDIIGRSLVVSLNGDVRLVNFFNHISSIATTNSPAIVKYYAEQAHLCNIVKSYSATLAMYRTLLDAILFEQNYKQRMAGEKIAQLEKDLAANSAPKWAKEIKPDFLKVVKDLGNSSLHISNLDVSKEQALSPQDIEKVELVLSNLLYLVYEKQKEEDDLLDKLKSLEAAKK